jgi:hypothetical protein
MGLHKSQSKPANKEKEGLEAFHCSFCGKPHNQVKKMIAGPSVCICNECIDICNEIISDGNLSAGTMTCPLCRQPDKVANFISIPERGLLCIKCLEAIRAVSDGSESSL